MTHDEHDGLTHVVETEDATETVCGIERTIWVSVTTTPDFATCEDCVAGSD